MCGFQIVSLYDPQDTNALVIGLQLHAHAVVRADQPVPVVYHHPVQARVLHSKIWHGDTIFACRTDQYRVLCAQAGIIGTLMSGA